MAWELLHNGSFEYGDRYWDIGEVDRREVQITDSESHCGRRCVMFSPTSREHWIDERVWVEQGFSFPVEADELTLWIKSSGPEGIFRVDFDHGSGFERGPETSGRWGDWTFCAVTPPRPSRCIHRVRVLARSSIRLYIDDVSLQGYICGMRRLERAMRAAEDFGRSRVPETLPPGLGLQTPSFEAPTASAVTRLLEDRLTRIDNNLQRIADLLAEQRGSDSGQRSRRTSKSKAKD